MGAPSYEVQLDRVHALLTEWGECQLREPYPGVQGYPRATVEGRLMDEWGERPDGTAPARPHSSGPRQTKVRVIKRGDEWPEHIQRVDRILSRLDRRTMRVVFVCYVMQRHTTREIAAYLRVGKDQVARSLERARWLLVGALSEVDAA